MAVISHQKVFVDYFNRAPFQAWLKLAQWNSTRKHAIANASYFRMLSRNVFSNFTQVLFHHSPFDMRFH